MRKGPCFFFLFFNIQGWSCLNCCGGGLVIRVSSQSPPQGGLDVVNSKGLPSLVQSDHIFHPSSLTRWLAVDNLFFFLIFRMLPVQTVNSRVNTSTLGFPGVSVVKNLPANTGDLSSIPGSGRSPREGNGNPLQYLCLENSMEYSPPGSPTGGLHSMGSQSVGHSWENNTFAGWRFFLKSQLTLRSETPRRGFLAYMGTSHPPAPPCHRWASWLWPEDSSVSPTSLSFCTSSLFPCREFF